MARTTRLYHPHRWLPAINAMGFETYAFEDGQRVWKDACVVESLLAGPKCPCDWLEMDRERRAAYLARTEPGAVVSRDNFLRPND